MPSGSPQYYTSDLSQVTGKAFVSRNELRDTIIHEELHHRWWKLLIDIKK